MVVAALSAISVAVLADMRRSSRLSANAGSLAQAQWYAIGAEAYARVTANDLVSGALPRTALAGAPRVGVFPLDHGMMQVSIRDGSTCINLNSVVSGAGDIWQRNETGMRQLVSLMETQGIPSGQAEELADAVASWIDTSGVTLDLDDAPYRSLHPPYITSGEPLSEVSELRAIRGFTPEIVVKIRPWVCALPQTGPSGVNLNALIPDQAPVLAALAGNKLSVAEARSMIQRRPPGGWQSLGEVFANSNPADLGFSEDALQALNLDINLIALDIVVTHLDAEIQMSGLLVGSSRGFVTAARRWTEDT
jgi:general secretion pathway protein K